MRRHCIDCGRMLAGPCEFCQEKRERLEEQLEVCRTCDRYKSKGGHDGCRELGKECCTLAVRLKHGWECPLGLHSA